jgi:hypothetical protein
MLLSDEPGSPPAAARRLENSVRPHNTSACGRHVWATRCFRADVCRKERSVPLIEADRALELRGTRAQPSRPACHKRPTTKGLDAQLSALALHLPTPMATR